MEEEPIEWVPLSLTHVVYRKGDLVGKGLAFISLAPFAVLVAFATLILFKRELDTVLFFSGQMLNEMLNLLLKNIIREERPLQVVKATHSPKTFGMPSQHAQFQAFFSVYCCLFILFRLKYKPWYFKGFSLLSILVSLFAVIYSRVYLLYHFWSQCLVGIAVGTTWAIIFFVIVYSYIEPNYFRRILSWPLSAFFGLKKFNSNQINKSVKFK